jgi:hypothetical protein
MHVAKLECLAQIKVLLVWLQQSRSIERGFKTRFNIDTSGKILEVDAYGNSTLVHLFHLEEMYKLTNDEKIIYLIFKDELK